MDIEKLEKLKKQQKILYFAIPLTAFMALMKYTGAFATGSFPIYFDVGVSIMTILLFFYNSIQIKKIEASSSSDE